MANAWFRFKQFTVHQQYAAMKVTTDACLFGALLPEYEPSDGIRMLDIGTGTGLLSLMAAQKNPCSQIIGVEIDQAAAEEATQNIAGSLFKENITVVQGNVLNYTPEGSFHHIFSNPPFYENQLASPGIGKNLAHHSSALTLVDILAYIKLWLMPEGSASLLVPFYREEETIALAAKNGLFVHSITRVKPTSGHSFFRSILLFYQRETTPVIEELVIKGADNQYTEAFSVLLRPFYLKL